jgi:hypothetical protein
MRRLIFTTLLAFSVCFPLLAVADGPDAPKSAVASDDHGDAVL